MSYREESTFDPPPACPHGLLDLEDIDSYPAYEAWRGDGVVRWDEALSAWLLLGYEECRLVKTDEGRFANPYLGAPPLVVKVKGGTSNITLTHGEEHARLRCFRHEPSDSRSSRTLSR